MSKNRVTIVCCYNNETQLKNELLASIYKQIERCDLILIDNRTQEFNSCSKALNSVLKRINTEYVIFSHQDIIMTENYTLSKFVNYMSNGKTGDIYGVAGASIEKNGLLSTMYHGKNKEPVWEVKLTGIQPCDAVDECFFGGKTKTFQKSPFNEKICNNWHLYAAERCIYTRTNGHSVYVCDVPIIHSSKGKLSHEFNLNFRNLCKAYAKYYSEIYTTFDRSKTNLISRNLHYLKKEIKLLVIKLFNLYHD